MRIAYAGGVAIFDKGVDAWSSRLKSRQNHRTIASDSDLTSGSDSFWSLQIDSGVATEHTLK